MAADRLGGLFISRVDRLLPVKESNHFNRMKKTNLIISTFLLLCLFSMTGCGSDTHGDYKPEWKAEHVVFIGLDGWGSYSVEKADMLHVKQLMSEGCYTLQKRTVLPSSSAVNWASMFMGAGPELHGYTT